MRLEPSILKSSEIKNGEIVWDDPPIHTDPDKLADGIHISYEDIQKPEFSENFENNCLIRELLPSEDERKEVLKDWLKTRLDYQSWCEDPVCEPDETILYKVLLFILFWRKNYAL